MAKLTGRTVVRDGTEGFMRILERRVRNSHKNSTPQSKITVPSESQFSVVVKSSGLYSGELFLMKPAG